jgi:hypothetical protein
VEKVVMAKVVMAKVAMAKVVMAKVAVAKVAVETVAVAVASEAGRGGAVLEVTLVEDLRCVGRASMGTRMKSRWIKAQGWG